MARVKPALLTPVQRSVLAEAASGDSLSRVAQRLNRSRTYVASRLSETYKRLGLESTAPAERRAEAVRIAREAGLIP
jgi:DNA-binding NarL/FixJ family response regulator